MATKKDGKRNLTEGFKEKLDENKKKSGMQDNGTPVIPASVQPTSSTAVARFMPTENHKRAKCAFWAVYEPDPLMRQKDIELSDVLELLPIEYHNLMTAGWENKHCISWFLNKNEHKAKLEYLYDKALDAAHSIIENEDPKAQGARVQMIKLISELANKQPPKVQQGGQFEEMIAKMDKAELTAYIEKQGSQMKLTASRGMGNRDEDIIDIQTTEKE